MSPEAQRIAIAEACGWTKVHYEAGHKPPYGNPPGKGIGRSLPNYLNDLNAVHEAEMVLTEEQRSIYCYHLLPNKEQAFEREDVWIGAHATSAQRAEAFLRTLNLWKE